MIAQDPFIPAFVRHLRTLATPFKVPRHAAPAFEDSAAHAEALRRDPELYALLALAEKVRPPQQARVLFHLLAGPRAGLTEEGRRTTDRVTGRLLSTLAPDTVLSAFLALRRARANHRHARRAVAGYLLGNPAAPGLALRRRRAVRDALEHALGRNVARACAKLMCAAAPAAEVPTYVRRNLPGLTGSGADQARIRAMLRFLYPGLDPDGSARTALEQTSRDRAAVEAPEAAEAADEAAAAGRPKTVTATNRGDVAATLVHLYRGGDSPDLQAALGRYADEAAARLPRFDGRVALVLDASASTRGYGEREFACVSQSQALRLVMRRCSADLCVFTVGRPGPADELPQPEGVTNLADPLLDALEAGADVVAVVSDGYENVFAGDLARVATSLAAAGVNTPVVFCHSKFTEKDDLSRRRPAPALPQVEFWHQDDFADVLWSVFSRAGNGLGEDFARRHLRGRLELLSPSPPYSGERAGVRGSSENEEGSRADDVLP